MYATDVNFQRISESSRGDEAQTRWRVVLDKMEFQVVLLKGWSPVANYGGLDFAAIAPSGSGAVVGIRIRPLVDSKGQPLQKITPELVAEEVARLQRNKNRPSSDGPKLAEPVEEFDFEMEREEGGYAWKGHYRLRVANNLLWFYACETPPSQEEEALKSFVVLLGTFSPAATEQPNEAVRPPSI